LILSMSRYDCASFPHHDFPQVIDVITRIRISGEEEQGRLQEQLTTYLDSVEQNLMTKIQSRSEQFYRALDELQHLYTQVGLKRERL
jgi:hypothetical protein